jgi:predicted AlkP superfamily pyrophosphatase or phosphodiesterase
MMLGKRKAILCGMIALLFIFGGCGEQPPPRPAVAVIIIDGLRPDILEEAHTPFMDNLRENGMYTARAQSVMPTVTRVNFVTIMTGVRTDRHGVVGGTYRDADFREQRTDRPTYREAQEGVPVPTVFEILEEHGFRTGAFVMKGYELVGARGASVQTGGAGVFPPELWNTKYDRVVEGSEDESLRRKLQMNEVLIDTLSAVLGRESLDFVLINLGATDYIGHSFGPESDAYRTALETTDRQVADVAGILKQRYPDRGWMIIIGSDHGFTQTNENRVVLPVERDGEKIPQLVNRDIEHALYERGGRAAELYLQNPGEHRFAYSRLAHVSWIDRIYTNHEIPNRAGTLEDLHVDFPGRHGDFYIITKPDYALNFANAGQHGSNDDSDILVPLLLFAPGVTENRTMPDPVTNADITPTVLRLFGIDDDRIGSMDGRSIID